MALIALPVSSANALGTASRACVGGYVTGSSTTTYGSTANMSGSCGTVYVRVKYTHMGGSTWTPWSSASTYAYREANNTFQGQHMASSVSTFTT